MTTLRISPDVGLPLDAVTQKLAFLGISGSGKTYATGKFVEELVGAGAQVVVVDTVGNWHGLRLAANGKDPGIPIPILGGAKGDVPLEAHHGKLAAETVAGTRASMILDVSDFTKSELHRFVLDFATELLRLKKKSPSAVMIVWEECQDIVPQRVFGDQARTVGAVERLIKRGRNYGVGTVLISQRPAAVNKDVLSQIETLFAFRLNGKHDRKAISEWIVEQDLDIGMLVDKLPSMSTGHCYLWSPQWLRLFKAIKIGKKWTFDASATPEFGKEVKSGKLAEVDLEVFKRTMGEAIEKARANDPEALRARVKELEKKLQVTESLERQATAALGQTKVEVVDRPIFTMEDWLRLEKIGLSIVDHVQAMNVALNPQLLGLRTMIENVRQEMVAAKATRFAESYGAPKNGRALAPLPRPTPSVDRQAAAAIERRDLAEAREALSGPERRVLDAIAWFRAVGIEEPSTVAVAFKSGYSGLNGTFNNVRGKLHVARLVEYGDGTTKLTPAGLDLAVAPTFADAPTTEKLQAEVLRVLDGPKQRVLGVLLKNYPEPVATTELAVESGYAGPNGTFNNVRGRLHTMGLVEYVGRGMTKASDILFVD